MSREGEMSCEMEAFFLRKMRKEKKDNNLQRAFDKSTRVYQTFSASGGLMFSGYK